MNHGVLFLFAIPALCIIVIAIAQFKDEVFKKKFILERRNRAANSQNPAHNRRYSDRRAPGAAQPETNSERPAATADKDMETSGVRQLNAN
jgi:hypothetical protein